jgi:hypothetical protein
VRGRDQYLLARLYRNDERSHAIGRYRFENAQVVDLAFAGQGQALTGLQQPGKFVGASPLSRFRGGDPIQGFVGPSVRRTKVSKTQDQHRHNDREGDGEDADDEAGPQLESILGSKKEDRDDERRRGQNDCSNTRLSGQRQPSASARGAVGHASPRICRNHGETLGDSPTAAITNFGDYSVLRTA